MLYPRVGPARVRYKTKDLCDCDHGFTELHSGHDAESECLSLSGAAGWSGQGQGRVSGLEKPCSYCTDRPGKASGTGNVL
jgi:hypothetical protein